jgi:hypothetical protein
MASIKNGTVTITFSDFKNEIAKPEHKPVEKIMEEKVENLPWYKRLLVKATGNPILKREIRQLDITLETMSPNDPDYAVVSANRKTLSEAYQAEMKNRSDIIGKAIGAAVTLIGLVVLLVFEGRGGVVTSKSASSWLPKPKL